MDLTRTSPYLRRHDILAKASAAATCYESLERRVLFVATPLFITEATTAAGPELSIDGTPGDDRISVVAYGDTLMLANKGGWQQIVPNHYALIRINGARGNDVIIVDGSVDTDAIVRGSNGDDTIFGGAGDDQLYGGFGRDRMLGGAGDDSIVSIGDSVQDRVSGDDGLDSFWTDVQRTEVITDASPDEIAIGAVHRVASFYATPAVGTSELNVAVPGSRDLGASDLPDPLPAKSTIKFANFADRPLFADAGPTPLDIKQGAVGDCYFLVTLASIAQQNPELLRQAITELGDGTYAVRYHRDGLDHYVRVDADLPLGSFGNPAYAALGKQQSLWVALMEKAYAFFRTGAGTYLSLGTGWMSETFAALNAPSQTIWMSEAKPAAELLTQLKAELDAGAAITWATHTIPAGVTLVASHAYSVASVNLDADGNAVSITLRNPWAYDGGGSRDGANDGLVTLTVDQIAKAFSAIMYARV